MLLTVQRKLLLFVFFLSGFAALIYEVIWVRMLSLVFGSTMEAVSAVVTAFMAGLTLGSYFMGRLSDARKNLLHLYSFTEFCIGLLALFSYYLISNIYEIQNAIYRILPLKPIELLLSGNGYITEFLLVFVPAIFIGATFPLMVKTYISSENHIGAGISLVYAINTAGAVFGAFLSGFFLIPQAGISGTFFTAVVINICLSIVVYLIKGSYSPPAVAVSCMVTHTHKMPSSPILSRTLKYTLFFIMGLSGFASLSYQIAWTRVLTMIIGNSVYVFSLILTVFLIGLSMGSLFFFKQIDRLKDKVLLLGILQILLCFSVLISNQMIDSLPSLFILLFRSFPTDFKYVLIIKFAIAFLIIIIPTFLMGASFPICARILTSKVWNLGEELGKLYSMNTLGAILGSFLTGFILIPYMGTQKSIFYITLLNLLSGTVLTLQAERLRKATKFALATTAGLSFIFYSSFIHDWDKNLLNRGVYLYAEWLKKLPDMGITLKDFSKGLNLLYFEEGRQTTVAVTESDTVISLQINGKTDAGTSKEDMTTQIMLAMLPLIAHSNPQDIAIVGLGSGITLGAAERFPVRNIDCIEISRAVIHANKFFSSFNHNALDDPRATLVRTDARRHLSTTSKRYDVIISEPSNPWITGVSNLFTLDFFEIARKRLNKDGLICQWIHLYSLDTKELKTLLNTFNTAFSYVTVWGFSSEDLLMIGSDKPIGINEDRLNFVFENYDTKIELLRAGLGSSEEFKNAYIMGNKEVKRFSRGAGINTDDKPIIEFEAPKAIFLPTAEKNRKALLSAIDRH